MTPQERNERRQLSAELRNNPRLIRLVVVQQSDGSQPAGVSFAEMMSQLRGDK